MLSKRIVRWIIVVAFMVMLLATPKPALAWSGCGSSYVVQWGDTLGSVAATCGTSVDALRQANPNVGYWIYAGQTLSIPGGYQDGGYTYGYQDASDCYGYQAGRDYYGGPYGSNCYGTTYATYAPPSGPTYVVQRGDTMRIIADRMGIPLTSLIAANPQIWNPNLIYVGQIICLPSYFAQPTSYWPGKNWGQPAYYGHPGDGDYGHPRDGHWDHYRKPTNLYTIERGETLKEIARKFDTTQEALLDLNPVLLGKPGRIHAGQVIRIY